MSKIKGRDFIVFTAVTGQVKALGCSTACTLNIEQELVETLNKSNWRWRRYVNGKRGWSIEVGGYIDNGGIDPMTMLGVSFVVGFATVASHEAMNADNYVADGRRQYYGIGQLASCQLTGELEGYATYSLSFQGSGELTTSAPLLVDDGEGNVSLVLTTSLGESVYVPGLGNSAGGSYLSAYTGQAIDASVAATQTSIPASMLAQQNARYSAFGAVYDSGTGTWKMHNVGGTYLVTGLTAADMEKICASPDFTTGVIFAGAMRGSAKTNRGIDVYRIVRAANQPVDFTQMARDNTSLQVFYAQRSGTHTYCVDVMTAAFYGCTALKIVKYLDVSRCTAFSDTFKNCTALEECYLKGVDATLDLGAASNLTQDSLIYIVEQAGTSAKELVFVSSLVTNWQATADYPTWSDFETYAASKNFTFNHNAVQHLDLDWEQ